MPEPRFRLTDLDLDFVSLVAAGDDPMARVVLAKAEPALEYDVTEPDRDVLADIFKMSAEPLGTPGGKQNWVDKVGGLPHYIQHIAKDLHEERGMDLSRAIATAISQVKKWAAGGEGVKPDTVIKAQAALAEWEEKKARAHVGKEAKPGSHKPHAYSNTDAEKNGATKCDQCGMASNAPMHQVSRKRSMKKNRGSGDSSRTLPRKTTKEARMGTINKADLDPEVLEYVEALEAEVTDLTAEAVEKDESIVAKDATIADLTSTLEKSAPKDDESQAEITKSLLAKADPALRSLIEKQQADIAAATSIAKAERDARLEREFISKAETLPMISDDKASLGTILRAIAEALPAETVEKVDTILKAANEQIRQGNLFSVSGLGGAETTVSKSVEAAAEEVKKANPSFTKEQAMAQAFRDNPDLLAQALTDQEV